MDPTLETHIFRIVGYKGINRSLSQRQANRSKEAKQKTKAGQSSQPGATGEEMEKAKQFLELTEEESEIISRLAIPTHRPGSGSCFYEDFALKGIRVDRVEAGLVVCTFKVPPRLTDRDGKLATGAIANLVDEVGSVLVHVESPSMNVSVDISISFLSTAKVDDELEITSRLLGQKKGYSGTIVLMKNKATGDIIAEGRHSLFATHVSKL